MNLKLLLSDLESLKNPNRVKDFSWFFKTGPGQYGEGDKFLGIMTQPLRTVVDKYWQGLDFNDIEKLFNNPFHECRNVAVSTLCRQFAKASPESQKQIFDFYLAHTKRINNWDLVDISASRIVGEYLLNKDRKILYQLAKSNLLWDRRISIIATFAFIKNNDFQDTLKISQLLLNDKEDLMHKAVGWALREVGKKDLNTLTKFLDEFTPNLPRTTLRYAIEKFPESQRQYYLHLK